MCSVLRPQVYLLSQFKTFKEDNPDVETTGERQHSVVGCRPAHPCCCVVSAANCTIGPSTALPARVACWHAMQHTVLCCAACQLMTRMPCCCLPAELSSMMQKAWEALEQTDKEGYMKQAEEEAEAAAAAKVCFLRKPAL